VYVQEFVIYIYQMVGDKRIKKSTVIRNKIWRIIARITIII